MKETNLFRLAMAFSNNSASTLDKCICKLSLSLMAKGDGLTIEDLSEKMSDQFELDFTEEEIADAIKRKGGHDLSLKDGKYYINNKVKKSLFSNKPLSEKLENCIKIFCNEKNIDDEKYLNDLLKKYLYYCFDNGVDSILSLYDKKTNTRAKIDLHINDYDISLINAFMSWDNTEKDNIIYDIVSVCYEYCMLTMKKDNVFSKEIFRGKKFFLDSNIIFRMAGINNDDRKFVTKTFEKKCRDVGIKLICSSVTYDEINRVINYTIEDINSFSGSKEPIDYRILQNDELNYDINDFYKRYYEWCQKPENNCGDYRSYERYLYILISKVISSIESFSSNSYNIGDHRKNFNQLSTDLQLYKNKIKRKERETTLISAQTDITNYLDIKSIRNSKSKNILETNEFLVSADRRLVEWEKNTYPGVPIVVLPSVWLSIIMKYSGRTKDDYRSFCLFLTQRYNNSEKLDAKELLKTVNIKTDKKQIKEQIVSELVQNKNKYNLSTPENLDKSADLAFDKILKEIYEKKEEEIKKIKSDSKINEEKIISEFKFNEDQRRKADKEGMIAKLAQSDLINYKKNIEKARRVLNLLAIIFFVLAIVFLLLIIFNVGSLYTIIVSFIPVFLKQNFALCLTILQFLLSGFCKFFERYLQSLLSDDHLNEKYLKFHKKYSNKINDVNM